VAETHGAQDAVVLGFIHRLEVEAVQPSELGRAGPVGREG
jgi:hypothetical protein